MVKNKRKSESPTSNKKRKSTLSEGFKEFADFANMFPKATLLRKFPLSSSECAMIGQHLKQPESAPAALAALYAFMIELCSPGHDVRREADQTIFLSAIIATAGAIGKRDSHFLQHCSALAVAVQPEQQEEQEEEEEQQHQQQQQEQPAAAAAPAPAASHETGAGGSIEGFTAMLQEPIMV